MMVLCFNSNEQHTKLYWTALCQFEFPEPDVQNSVQLKMESMTMDEYGHVMDESYQCIHYHPVRTQASQNWTMMNVEKYMVIQLKIFKYDQISKDFSKTVANLMIQEKMHNILLGTSQLQEIVHISISLSIQFNIILLALLFEDIKNLLWRMITIVILLMTWIIQLVWNWRVVQKILVWYLICRCMNKLAMILVYQ